MTGAATGLRGLVLTTLVVSSAVVSVVALSGTAAAAGNDVAIDSAVEADGTVEVVFNASTFSDPPEASDVDIWVDGTRVVDDGASDTNLGGQTWGITDFTQSDSNATFDIQTDGTTADIDPDRNLTVEFEGVARSGATNRDPESEVAVTQAVVADGGLADTELTAQRIYPDGPIAIRASDDGTDIFVQNTDTGGAVVDSTTGPDSNYIVLDGRLLDTGAAYRVEFGGRDPQFFNLTESPLTATAGGTRLDDETALTADVDSVNGDDRQFTATLLDDSNAEVDTVTGATGADGTATVDFGPQPVDGEPYEVQVVDDATGETVRTAAIAVAEPTPDGVDAAVEADGTVELLFNTSSFSDPPEKGDLNVWVDGTQVVDSGTSGAMFDGTVWSVANFTRPGRNVTFTVQAGDDGRDIAATRNLTVGFEGVAWSSGSTDLAVPVEPTQAVVVEAGPYGTAGNALRVYQGGLVALEGDGTNTGLFVENRETGRAVLDASTGPDSNYTVLDTQTLDTGVTYQVTFDGVASQYFTVRDLELTARATDTAISEERGLTVDVDAVRTGTPFTATLLDADGNAVDTTTALLTSGTTTVDFGPQAPGEYTVRVVDNETTATATTTDITVTASTPSSVDSAVEAGGDVEVVFDTASFSDPPEAGDVALWVDGTRVVDDGESDATLSGRTWSIDGFERAGRNVTFAVRADGTKRDIAAGRNLTVAFDGVRTASGDPDPQASVTTTQAVVREGGSAGTAATARRVYDDGPVAVEADGTDAEVVVESTGQTLRTGTDSRLAVLSTGPLPAGVTELQFDGDVTNDQFVTVADLGLTATATDTSIDEETALTVDVRADRGGEPFTATLVDADGTEGTRVSRLLDATSNVTVDFGTQSPGEYTVRVVDTETNASATTAAITVAAADDGGSDGGDGGGGNADTGDGGGSTSAGGGSSGNSAVLYDPADIRALVDLPPDVRPLLAERATNRFDSTGTDAVFTGEAGVTLVGFDEYAPGEVVVASVDHVERGTAPVPGRLLTAARVDASDDTTGANWTLRMRVDRDDMAAADATAGDLELVHFADGDWTTLNTSVHSRTNGAVVLAAETAPADFFAVRASAAPTASVDVPRTTVEPGAPVVLDGGDSTTPYGDLVAASWSVDGRTPNGSTATVQFDEPGTYTATLTVTNDAGATDTATATVTVAADTATPAGPSGTDTEKSTAASPTGTTAGSGPGFGVTAALLALSLAVLARRPG